MRIAFVTHYAKLYGANRSLLGLVDGLQAYGVKSHVIAPKQGPIAEELSERETSIYTIPFKRWMAPSRWKAPARLALNLAVLPFIVRQIRQWDIDLIHTNSSVTPVGALAAEILSLPHVWHVREFGELDFGLQHDWGEGVFRGLVSRSAAAIAVSKAVREHVLTGIDIPRYVVYNGVISRDRLEALGRKAEQQKEAFSPPFTFAIVGQIRPAKGQMRALQAVACLKQKGCAVRLLIAGSGRKEYVEPLRRLRRYLNLEQEVSMLGFVSDPFEVYQRADAVLMCSPHEAMGRVTAEAMAASRPVIGYDNDGTAELIDDGHNGLLYNGNISNLAYCMQQFVDNPKWARSLGTNGNKKAKTKFVNDIYSKKIYKIFNNIVHKKHSIL